jgi:predicted ATP-binding protein involved in virulence
MKKLSVLFCFLLLSFLTFSVSATARKLTKKDIPSAVISAFEKSYPNATVKSYSREKRSGKTVYEIESMDGQTRRDLIYSTDGTALEIEERISPSDLPDSVKQAIDKEYPKSKIKSAERLTKGTSIEYEVVIKRGKKSLEVVFDESGKVSKATKP